MSEQVLQGITVLAVAGASALWLAWRLHLPSILLLLLSGFLVGPVLRLLEPDRLLGDALFPLASVSVALILYEGGLTLKFRELRDGGRLVWALVSIGAAVTWGLSALAAHWILGLPAQLAVLLGAILVVTGPTVILPLLQHIRPTGPTGSILKWEGIVIDPIGALLAVLVYEVIAISGVRDATMLVAVAVAKTVIAGGGLGVLGAGLLTLMLRRYWIPDFLQNAVSLMLVVAAFVTSNQIQHESGLFSVTVMGIALANQKFADIQHIVEFKENLRILLISALFILLAARISPRDLTSVGWRGAVFVLVLIVIVRPAGVFASTWMGKLKRSERLFLAWMAPRGIVAAAVASVFAFRLEDAGYPEAGRLVPITFLVIISTVAAYGLTAPLVAHRLGVAEPRPQGVLMVGAHSWARAIAEVLREKGIRVLLVDSNRANTAATRMAGLATYTGSALADYALDEIDLGGMGRLMALTPNDWVNVLAVQRFSRIFGRSECYQLPPAGEEQEKSIHCSLHGRWLFASHLSFAELQRRFAAGAVVKATALSESFPYEAFQELYGATAVPLFILTKSGSLHVLSAERRPEPEPGQTLIALVDEPPSGAPDAAR
ncbi:MAG: sodium:proton antiporter [Phycisphaerae bacterium]|nr:sodium:proton antiporter [Phycisphaerae bacterium]